MSYTGSKRLKAKRAQLGLEQTKSNIMVKIKLGDAVTPCASPTKVDSDSSETDELSSSSDWDGVQEPTRSGEVSVDSGGSTIGYSESENELIIDESPGRVKVSIKSHEQKKGRGGDSEEEWLEALEGGDLDNYGQLRKSGSQYLTARQRALIYSRVEADRSVTESNELPSETPELTEAQLLKRQQRATRRKQQANEKREKEKKQTLKKLLTKQQAKLRRNKGVRSAKGGDDDEERVRLTSNYSGISISLPVGVGFPLQQQSYQEPAKPSLCGVSGCTNQRKYECSRTGVSLCSLACYKSNLSVQGPTTKIC